MKPETDPEASRVHRSFGISLSAFCRGLLDAAERTKADDELMIHSAHAACYHWLCAGSGIEHQRAEWLTARVYAELGIAESALRHASRCLELTDEHSRSLLDTDRAHAFECAARAYAAAGNRDEAIRYQRLAESSGEKIKDESARERFFAAMNAGRWYGLRSDRP